jgi:chromosome partitioning protein
MKVLIVTNCKGGVAKTTTTVNVAASLARLGYRVLIIDLDSQGSAGISLGYAPASNRNEVTSIEDCFFNSVPIQEAVIGTWHKGLDLVLASTSLAWFDLKIAEYSEGINKYVILSGLLKEIKGEYDFCLIDTPPSLGCLTINGLNASDHILIPLPPTSLDINSLYQFLEELSTVRQICSIGTVLGIVLTRVKSYKTMDNYQRFLRNEFKDLLLETQVRESVKIPQSAEFGKDVWTFSKRSLPAKQYYELTKELLIKII